jgi:hypothetical protein
VVLFLENAMLRRCLSAVLWAALALITPTTYVNPNGGE